jgi:HlyD family secretion protein
MKISRIAAGLLLFLSVAGASACGQAGGDNAGRDSQQLAMVTKGDLVVSVRGSGRIETARGINLSSSSGGKLVEVYVKEGNEVNEGDILAKLDTQPMELRLKQAQVALTAQELAITQAEINVKNTEIALEKAEDAWLDTSFAGKKVKRLKSYLEWHLNEDPEDTEEILAIKRSLQEAWDRFINLATDSTDARQVAAKQMELELARQSLEHMKQSLGQFQQAMDQAEKDLIEATIIAPFDGVVASVGVKEGDFVQSGISIIYMVDLTNMELIAEMDELDMSGLRLNQETVIDIDALPDITLKGRVASIYPVPTSAGGIVMYNVRIDFEVPKNSGLLIGMNASVNIVIHKRSNVLLLPSQAIEKDSQGNSVVTIVADGQLEERSVIVGISDGSKTEIISGINEGETIVY